MAKDISLILHRFKDVRTSILTLIFEDSPTFNNNGAQRYLDSHELSGGVPLPPGNPAVVPEVRLGRSQND